MNIDYKQKALKYKTKYFELKNKFEKMFYGGENVPEWYAQFETELRQIYDAVSSRYPDVIVTGSGVIAYLLNELKMYEEFEELKELKPNDLDFLYKSKLGEHNPNIILDYKIKPEQVRETSVTFVLDKTSQNSESRYIKSFDVSKTDPRTKSFNLNGIEFVNLNKLKSDYVPDFGTPDERIEKDKRKISLIDKIIQRIGKEGRLNEFGLDDNVSVRNPKRKSSLFDDFSDDESENEFNKNLNNLSTDSFMANLDARFKNYDDFDNINNSSSFESPKKKTVPSFDF